MRTVDVISFISALGGLPTICKITKRLLDVAPRRMQLAFAWASHGLQSLLLAIHLMLSATKCLQRAELSVSASCSMVVCQSSSTICVAAHLRSSGAAIVVIRKAVTRA
jgi:hypothetical protein